MHELRKFFLTLQSEIFGFEIDGYKQVSKLKDENEISYEFLHARNKNTLLVVANLNFRYIKIFKNGKLVKQIET